MSVFFKYNNIELNNFNNLTRRELTEFFQVQPDYLSYDDVKNRLMNSLQLLAEKDENKYNYLVALMYSDSYTILNYLNINFLASVDDLRLFDTLKEIDAGDEIDEYILEDLIDIEYNFLSLNELAKRMTFLNLTVYDDDKVAGINQFHILDMMQYQSVATLDDFQEFYHENIDSIDADDIIYMIQNYFIFLNHKYPDMYKESIKELFLYSYKWAKYIEDNSFLHDGNELEASVIGLVERYGIDAISDKMNNDYDSLYSLIDLSLYYKIQKEHTIVDKNEDSINVTIDDVEKHYQKIKKDF